VPPPRKNRPTTAEPGKSTLESYNLFVDRGRTSVRLEPQMWDALNDIARREGRTVNAIAAEIDRHMPPESSLTSAIRVVVMAYYRAAATEEGHAMAGHGTGRGIDAAALLAPPPPQPPRRRGRTPKRLAEPGPA